MAARTEVLEKAIEECLQPFKLQRLKKEQMEILQCLLDHRDCMAVLPTGYGKSLPYQIFTAVMRKIDESFDDSSKIIVCSPLVALMQEQVQRLDGKNDITAAVLGMKYFASGVGWAIFTTETSSAVHLYDWQYCDGYKNVQYKSHILKLFHSALSLIPSRLSEHLEDRLKVRTYKCMWFILHLY